MTTPADKLMSSAYTKLGLDISKIVIMVLSFFYGAGYLVQAITLRNYGIHRLEAVKLQYIEVGVTFSVILLLVTAMPVALYIAHFRIRRKSELPHYRIGAFGYLLNTYNLFFLVVCFALFVTQMEWTTPVLKTWNGGSPIKLSGVFAAYAVVATFVLICMPLLERLIVSRVKRVKLTFWLVIEPIRYGAVLLGILLDVLLVRTFPWVVTLGLRGLAFVASALLFAFVLYMIAFYMRKLGDRHSLHVLAAAGITGLFLLLYICINAYVYAIVRHIPMNRGGKLPLARCYLMTSDQDLNDIPLGHSQTTNCMLIGPVYVLDETDDYVHVADATAGEWYKEWVTTYAIRKDAVVCMRNERIKTGGPRSPASP